MEFHDERGELIAYVGRTIGDEQPELPVSYRFKKSLALFNLHRAAVTGTGAIIVFRRLLPHVCVHEAGFRNVLALMESTLSARFIVVE